MQPPVYIDTDRALARLAARLQSQPAIAVDTEANSLFAYRERLCLVQISMRGRDYLLDPLADLDLGLLAPVFADPAILKVFHDAEYDLLTLRRERPFEFNALFDTKVAAAGLGMRKVGLVALLEELLGVRHDKKMQRSNWGQRPLTPAQLDYARLDTHYLLEIALQLRQRLHKAGEPLILEVAAELHRLEMLQPEPHRFDADEFARIKGADRLDPQQRRTLRELFIMRNGLAEARDRPPFKIMGADLLLALARVRPLDVKAVGAVAAMTAKLVHRYADEIQKACKRAERLGPLGAMPVPRSEVDRLNGEQRAVFEGLRRWRGQVAASRHTDPSLVLARSTMLALCRLRSVPKASEQLGENGILEPWRVAHYGEAIHAILSRRSGTPREASR